MASVPDQDSLRVESIGAIRLHELAEKEAYSGAGIAFQLASAPERCNHLVFGYGDAEGGSNLRVNGKLYRLTQASVQQVTKGQGKGGLGERRIEVWACPDLTAVFDYVNDSVFEGGRGYRGTLEIRMNGHQARFRIKAGSGC